MPARERNAPKVTVFGFYGLGNFGDDLMGWMIARHLAAIGHPSVLCSLSDQPSDSLQVADFTEASIASTRSIEQALENSTAAVLGGGGLLVPHTDRKLKRFATYFSKIEHLLDAIAHRGIPLALISVGGDGDPSPDNLSRRARKAIGHASMITTRNPSDVALLEKCGITSHCYPDLVWLASTFRRRGRPIDSMRKTPHDCARPLRIGLDLYASNLIGKGMLRFLGHLYRLSWGTSHLQFVAIYSKHARCGSFSGMGAALSPATVDQYQFHDFESDFAQLASLDLLISSRLHVPIVALQLGVPTISIFSEAKTRIFFEANGLANAYLGGDRTNELFSLLRDEAALRSWLDAFVLPDLTRLRTECGGHFRRLQEFLDFDHGRP